MHRLSDLFGAEPAAVAIPQNVSELQEAVREAAEAGRAVIPWGAGTCQDYGPPPSNPDYILLDLSEMNHILAVEPGDLTITVESGTTLAAVQAALLPHRLFLPLDPPDAGQATIGGILAINAFGLSRLGYGTARDWLIGLSVVDAQGRLVKGGGKVVKNVTGYDLPKLHIGALGTLGVLAEATFKVAPLPEATRTTIVTRGAGSSEDGTFAGDDTFLHRILAETAPVQAYLRSDPTGRYMVFVYAGFVEAVEQDVERVIEAVGDIARITVVPELLGRRDDQPPQLALRLTGLPENDFARHEALTTLTLGSGATVETLAGCGISDAVWTEASESAADTARYVARSLVKPEGLATGYSVLHAPLAFRQEDFPLWSPESAGLPLMQRIKDALDPDRVLNPGRFVGGI